MSEYCYLGSAQATCDLNIGPYQINLDCVPEGDPTKPYDIILGAFHFGEWTGTPSDFWISSNTGTSGDDVIDGNGLLASIRFENTKVNADYVRALGLGP